VVLYGNNVHYTIAGILPGTYPDVVVGGAGYDSQVSTVSVGRGTTAKNWPYDVTGPLPAVVHR
jgi:hypothetical protein